MIFQLDGGEGVYHNESFEFTGHQLLVVTKQDGTYAGGRPDYTGMRTFQVIADYKKGCLDDIRFEGRLMPLPPALNGTHGGQATLYRHLEIGCEAPNACKKQQCTPPFECHDLWMHHVCA